MICADHTSLLKVLLTVMKFISGLLMELLRLKTTFAMSRHFETLPLSLISNVMKWQNIGIVCIGGMVYWKPVLIAF